MAYVTENEALEHLSLTEDMVAGSTLLGPKIKAAQNHVERLLGYKFAMRFFDPEAVPDAEETREAFPDSLREAVLQLLAWWFENREAAGPAVREVPFGVREIVAEYRDWTF